MIHGQFGNSYGLGWNPLSSVKSAAKKVGSTVATGAKYAGKGVVAAGKGVGKGAVVVGKTVKKGVTSAAGAAADVGKMIGKGIIKPFELLASAATAPIRNRVHTLRNRRAAKLAVDKRGKGAKPTPAEQNEAKGWTKNHLKKQGPHGQVLALFAGAPPDHVLAGIAPQYGELGLEPATASLIAASIPVFMALMNKVLGSADKSGEAPANPQADAAAAAEAPGGAPAAPGEVDLQPAQDAAAAVEQAAEDASGGGGGGQMVKLPGVGAVKKSHLLIGGGVVVGLLLLTSLTRRSGGQTNGALFGRSRRRRR